MGLDRKTLRSKPVLEVFVWSHQSKTVIISPHLLLVFSVTPFKIDQNKNQNRSIDKVQNLGNERRQNVLK